MATPPTLVAEYESTWNVGTTPRTASVTTAVGDVLVAVGITADQAVVLGTPTGGTSLTWTLRQEVNVSGYCRVYVWTATATTAETFTFSIARTGSTDLWGFNVLRYSGSDGIGASSKTNVSSGAPSLGLTTTVADSAIVIGVGDWNAVDGASRTWRTVGAAATEQSYFRDSSFYTVYVGRHLDSDATGAKTVGLSAPSGQKYSIVAVEVKGAAAAAVTGTLSASLPKMTSSISGNMNVTGTLSGAFPKMTGSAAGTVRVLGTLAGSFPKMTSSISEQGPATGTLNAAFPKLTSAIAGDVIVGGNAGSLFTDPFGADENYSEIGTEGGSNTTGTVVANPSGSGFLLTAPNSGHWRSPLRHSELLGSTTYTVRMMVTSSVTQNLSFFYRRAVTVGVGTSVTIQADVPFTAGVPTEYVASFTASATADAVGASGVSVVRVSGAFTTGSTVVIDGINIQPGVHTAAEMQPSWPTLPKMTGSASGGVSVAGTLSGTFPALTAALAGTVGVSGTLAGAFPKVTSSIAGTVRVTGTLAGTFPKWTSAMSGTVGTVVAGTLNGTFPMMVAGISGIIIPKYIFVTPVRQVYTSQANPLFRRVPYSIGTTILRENGIYRQVNGQTIPEDIDNAEKVYLGGHEYVITQAEANELEAAGYGEFIRTVG